MTTLGNFNKSGDNVEIVENKRVWDRVMWDSREKTIVVYFNTPLVRSLSHY